MVAGKILVKVYWENIINSMSHGSVLIQYGPNKFPAMTVIMFPPRYQMQGDGNSFPTLCRSVGVTSPIVWVWLTNVETDSNFIADLLKGFDVAAMLLSKTSKLLAGQLQPAFVAGLQQSAFLAGLQQPSSNLLQKSSKNGSGSKYFSTAPALFINKHPDVIRGKVTGHPTDHLPFFVNSFLLSLDLPSV